MKALKKIEFFIFESPVWKLIAAVFGIMLFKTGVWVNPEIGIIQKIAFNPFINSIQDPNEHFLFWNWLGPYLAWLVGAKSRVAIFIFHLLFSLAFSLLFIKIIFSRFSDKISRTSLILFCILPVSSTAYFWVGYDSITLFFMLLALAYPQYILLTLLSGIALGMQHFEQSFFASGALLFAAVLNMKYDDRINIKKYYSIKFFVLLSAAVILGKLALIIIFNQYLIKVNSGRFYWFKEHIVFLLTTFYMHFQSIIWGVLGLGNLFLIKYLDNGRKAIPFFITFFGLLLLLPFIGDHTRVLAITTFPLIAVYFLFNEEFLNKISTKEVSIIFLIWLLMPWAWVWGGLPRGSVFSHDIYFLLHKCFGHPRIAPENWEWWPFY
jgi:hypothetical protein